MMLTGIIQIIRTKKLCQPYLSLSNTDKSDTVGCILFGYLKVPISHP